MRHAFIIIAVGGAIALAALAWFTQPRKLSPSSASTPGHSSGRPSSPQTNIILNALPGEIQSLTLSRQQDPSSFRIQRTSPTSALSSLAGPWLISWSPSASSSEYSWPAAPAAVDSALSTLSQLSGLPAQAPSAQPKGSIIITASTSSPRIITIFPPGLGGLPLATIDHQSFSLSGDPQSIFDISTWRTLSNSLIAPAIGRNLTQMRINDGHSELVLERDRRQWLVHLHKNDQISTYRGDLAACEGLAKILTEATFDDLSPGERDTNAPLDAQPAATITLLRRDLAAPDPANAFHTALLKLFRQGDLSATTLTIASTLSLRDRTGKIITLGPVHGSVDPALLTHLSTDPFIFISRLALDIPAADITRLHIGNTTYARRLIAWEHQPTPGAAPVQPSDPAVESARDTQIRNFLLTLALAQAASVQPPPSNIPADALTLRLESTHLEREITLHITIAPGQVTILDATRSLTYTDPSTVGILTTFLRQ
jgi:hypothetical protein